MNNLFVFIHLYQDIKYRSTEIYKKKKGTNFISGTVLEWPEYTQIYFRNCDKKRIFGN